jgi:hypothetical protein
MTLEHSPATALQNRNTAPELLRYPPYLRPFLTPARPYTQVLSFPPDEASTEQGMTFRLKVLCVCVCVYLSVSMCVYAST